MESPDLITRVERFERTVATCLSIVPLLFSAQCLFTALCAPVFSAMLADFGAKLPGPTQLILSTWPLWAVVALAVPIAAIVVARKGKPAFSAIFSTVCGLVMFAVAQIMMLSLLLPLFQLGAVAAGK